MLSKPQKMTQYEIGAWLNAQRICRRKSRFKLGDGLLVTSSLRYIPAWIFLLNSRGKIELQLYSGTFPVASDMPRAVNVTDFVTAYLHVGTKGELIKKIWDKQHELL
jgi:hypothetical protein